MKPAALSCLLAALLLFPVNVYAHPLAMQATRSVVTSSYNLHSNKTAVTAGSLGDLGSLSIQVGGGTRTVDPSTLLTPAEELAVQEILSGVGQTIILNGSGMATGGYFQLSSLSGTISSLVIPKGVTALDNLSTNSNFTLSGNLINDGELLVYSTSGQSASGDITALNIINAHGATITSNATTSDLPGVAGLVTNASISLDAENDFANAGTVTSSGSLTVTSGGSITNAVVSGTSKSQPLLEAFNSVNLVSGSGTIANSGTITSATGDINISAPTSIAFNNSGGILQAPSGAVNFRNPSYLGNDNVLLTGGNLAAQNVNFYSGQGNVLASVDELQGTVNVYAGCAHVIASTKSLELGTMQISGDPTFYNENGNVVLSGNLVFPGQSLVIVASGNIESAPGGTPFSIDTSSTTDSGGNITMIAGASFSGGIPGGQVNDSVGSTLYITGQSSTGGNIDLSSGTPLASITSGCSGAGCSGGNITLVAMGGTITLPSQSVITTGMTGGGTSGGVTMYAQSLSVGTINTGPGSGAGWVQLNAADPAIATYTIGCGCHQITETETITVLPSGQLQGNFILMNPDGTISTQAIVGSAVNMQASTIQTKSITAPNGGTVNLSASAIYVTGDINAGNGSSTGNGGSVTLTSQGNILVTGDINAGNDSSAGNGGSVTLTSQGNMLVTGSITTAASGQGENGSVTLESGGFAPFFVGGAKVNGIGGSISAASVSITNPYSGITITNSQDLMMLPNPAQTGGLLSLSSLSGNLSIAQGTLSVYGAGGKISLTSDSISVISDSGGVATAPLNFEAQGGGGEILITVSNSGLQIGKKPGQISMSIDGGSNSNGGGTVSVTTLNDLTVDASALCLGNAPQLTLVSRQGNLLIDGSLNANGLNGSAGSITLSCVSKAPFVIGGAATTTGVTGTLSANASNSASGSGGTIIVTNDGSGGITLYNPTDVSVTASPLGGNGGDIALLAPIGTLMIAQGNLCANGTTPNLANTASSAATFAGNGGQIRLDGQSLVVISTNGGPATGPLNLSANGGTSGESGSIVIYQQNGDLEIGNCSGQISISALGGPAQPITSSSSTIGLSLVLVNSTLAFVGLTSGIFGGSEPLNPATVIVQTGGNLFVNTSALCLGDAPYLSLSASANLFIKGNLNANGIAGQGGSIFLTENSSQPFVVGGATTTGITGGISASGSQSAIGSGGTIAISNIGTGGIQVSSWGQLLFSASPMGGSGGTINLDATSGALTIPQGTLSADGISLSQNTSTADPSSAVLPNSQSTCCNGGTIWLQGSQITVVGVNGAQATAPLNLSANGSGSGNAGNITLIANGNLTIGSQPGQISMSALSGPSYTSPEVTYTPFTNTPLVWQSGFDCTTQTNTVVFAAPTFCCVNSIETYTGRIYVSTQGNITVDPQSLVAGPAANTSANGASIFLLAGNTYSNSTGSLLVTGSLSANGSGSGWGGLIVLASAGNLSVSANNSNPIAGVAGTVSACGTLGGSILLVSTGGICADPSSLFVNSTAGILAQTGIPTETNAGIVQLMYQHAQNYGYFVYPTSLSPEQASQYVPIWYNAPNDAPMVVNIIIHEATIDVPDIHIATSVIAPQVVPSTPAPIPLSTLPSIGPISIAQMQPIDIKFSVDRAISLHQLSLSQDGTSGAHFQSNSAKTMPTANLFPVQASMIMDLANPTSSSSNTSSATDIQTGQTNSVNLLVSFNQPLATEGSMNLDPANVVLTPEHDLSLPIPDGAIDISEGSAVLILNKKNSLAIYALHEVRSGSIKVRFGDTTIALSVGRELVLTNDHVNGFDDVNPGAAIAYRQVNSCDTRSDIIAYTAEFSLASALSQVSALKNMLYSPNAKDRRFAEKLIKNAAILSQLTSGHGPFQTAGTHRMADNLLSP